MKRSKPRPDLRPAAQWCGAVAAAIAVAVLLGWALKVRILSRFLASSIPMAPSTALGLLLLGGGLVASARWRGSRLASYVAALAAAPAVLLGALILLQSLTGLDLGIEGLLAPRPEPFGQVVTGRMSPITAGIFVLLGLALLTPLLLPARRDSWQLSATLSGFAFAIAGTIAVGYAFGTPLLYGGATIPVALPTAVAFLLVSTGLFHLAAPEVGILRQYFLGVSVRARLWRAFLPFSAILTLVVAWLNNVLLPRLQTNPALWASLVAIVAGLLAAGVVLFLSERTANAIEQAKAALQEGELAVMFSNIPDAVILTDERRRIVMINPAFTRLFGYTFDEVKGRATQYLYANPAEYEMQGRVRYNTEAGQQPAYEIIYRRKDGTTFLSDSIGAPVRDAEGKVIGFLGIHRDVTERETARAALEESEARYRRIVETANEGIWAADAQDRTTFVNQTMAGLLGYAAEEMLGHPAADFIFEEDHPDHHRRIQERRQGNPGRYERRFRRRDGSAVWMLVSATALQDDGGSYSGSFAMLTDITDRRRAEEEQRKVQKLESLGILAGGIAHDFNNILMGILGNLSLARAYAQRGADVAQFLETAESAALRARQLTQQLLTFAKGGAPIKKVTSLAELIVDTTTFALRGTQSRPRFTVAEQLWPAEIDGGQISQVIHNIVLNADQAMPAGGTIEVEAQNLALESGAVPALPAGDYVSIAIRDHGIGIAEEIASRIFDPYFTTKEAGSGLGLATAYSIVQAHKGHIAVESQPGAGAAFFVYLPATPEAKYEKTEERDQVRRGSGRILFMDDDEMVCAIAGRMLTSLGYAVQCAADGLEAIALYQQAQVDGTPFDLVITDLTVPGGMGGKETLARLKEIDPHARAIVSSGYSTDPIMSDYVKFGFQDVITKPYTLAALSQTVYRVLHVA